jgi:hypothetical protein
VTKIVSTRLGHLDPEMVADFLEAPDPVPGAFFISLSALPLKANKSQTRRSLEQAAYQHGGCGRQSTLSEESKRERKKRRSRRELSERLDVGRPEMFGGVSSEHFWIDGLRLRAASKAPQRRRPCRSRALLVDPSSFALVRSTCFNRRRY